MNHKKVLVVEDDYASSYLAIDALMKSGIERNNIITCTNGLQAVQIAKEQIFDLIIMDILLPGINGIQASKEIKSYHNGNSPKIIGYTANSFADQDGTVGEIMDAFLTKPVKADDFRAEILKALS